METLGRYRIEARIGEGAMADVFRAHDPDIERVVAIKALKPDYRRDAELGARFLREARAAGALSHPNIATIYDVGEADGVPYIALELIDGRPLDAVLQAQGRMPYERVLTLAAQLADALSYAHSQGVIHRDVKPSNVLLTADGKTAKLLDFGVARMGESDARIADRQMARTQAGQMIGTPRYMSPEQALGLPVDQRSDLFSLGVMLYEMITGKTAFDATGLATLALQIAQEKVAPIEQTAADCPPGLRQIIEKLLAKKPDQRFANGTQVKEALQRELAALSNEDAVHRRGLSLRVKLPLALVSITLAALLLSISAITSRQQHTLERMAINSGETITTFVVKNAAVLLADNAGLPPEQQDWAPLQAFVGAASQEGGVQGIVVTDASGTIRAANDLTRVGQRYTQPGGEARLTNPGEPVVTNVPRSNGHAGAMRFVRPIRYAGADFGAVDILLPRTALDAAMTTAWMLLMALAGVIMLVVLVIGYLSGAMVVRPLRRLQQSFDQALKQGFALRISHRRRDEIGALFDGFNRLAAAIEPRLHETPPPPEPSLEATRIQMSPRRAA